MRTEAETGVMLHSTETPGVKPGEEGSPHPPTVPPCLHPPQTPHSLCRGPGPADALIPDPRPPELKENAVLFLSKPRGWQ